MYEDRLTQELSRHRDQAVKELSEMKESVREMYIRENQVLREAKDHAMVGWIGCLDTPPHPGVCMWLIGRAGHIKGAV